MHRLFSYIEEKPWHVIAILFVFHVLIASLMSWLAYSPYLSSLHNGAGFWKFSIDATLYHKEAMDLLVFLDSGSWSDWWEGYPSHKHVRLISFIYWFFGEPYPIFFEVVNSFVWVVSVVLIYNASYHLFDKSVKIAVAASLFMFFPSVLLSSVQIMRDQFYILGLCFIIYGVVNTHLYSSSWVSAVSMIIGYALMIVFKDYIAPLFLLVFVPWILILLGARKIGVLSGVIMLATISFITIYSKINNHGFYQPMVVMPQTQTQTHLFYPNCFNADRTHKPFDPCIGRLLGFCFMLYRLRICSLGWEKTLCAPVPRNGLKNSKGWP